MVLGFHPFWKVLGRHLLVFHLFQENRQPPPHLLALGQVISFEAVALKRLLFPTSNPRPRLWLPGRGQHPSLLVQGLETLLGLIDLKSARLRCPPGSLHIQFHLGHTHPEEGAFCPTQAQLCLHLDIAFCGGLYSVKKTFQLLRLK